MIDEIAAGILPARIKLVIGSRDGLFGIERAMQAGIRSEVIARKSFPDVASFSQRIFDLIDETQVDLVCLAGWLCLLDLPDPFQNRVMNIHPALLPSFG